MRTTETNPPFFPSNQSTRPRPIQRTGRRNVLVACETCKKRKVKCTAERPGCSNCRIRGHECRYAAGPSESYNASLKRRCQETERHNERLLDFFSAIRSMPEPQSYDIFRRVRAGEPPEVVVRQVNEAYLLLQLSGQMNRCSSPSCDRSNIMSMPAILLTPESSKATSPSHEMKPPPLDLNDSPAKRRRLWEETRSSGRASFNSMMKAPELSPRYLSP